jgi:hypothetical protein
MRVAKTCVFEPFWTEVMIVVVVVSVLLDWFVLYTTFQSGLSNFFYPFMAIHTPLYKGV